MTSLTEETLAQLRAEVSLPRYDRRQVTTGIVHIGFHRSHQAMYIDTLLNNGAAMDWGICGIGLQPSKARMRDVLAAQDGLYTLVLRHGDGTWDARVIGSIVEYLFAPDDPEAAIEKMAEPTTRIVSLTVTEGGYNLDAVTGEFNSSDASVLADLRPGAMPRTVFGLVTAALARRRDRGIPGFSVLSCDNIPGNGHVSQQAFTAFARLRDPALAEWMTRHVRFPNCMVDRDLIPKFLLPVIRRQIATGGPFTRLAAVVASWARYAEGTDETGETHELDDALAPQLQAAAGRQRRHPAAFVEDNRAVFGELADDPRFTEVYSSILSSLLERGVRKTLADLDHYATSREESP